MRWLRDIVFVLVLCALGAAALWYQSKRSEEQARLDKTIADRQRLEREVHFRAATKAADLNARGWPLTVDPGWFELDPPQNLLVSEERPWVEIAPAEEAGLMHPPVRLTLNEKMAAFWYNPYQGVVRARVPVSMTDDAATAMYNAVNRSSIASIHWQEKSADTPKPKQDKPAAEGDKKDGANDARAKAAPVREPEHVPPVVVVRQTTPSAKGH